MAVDTANKRFSMMGFGNPVIKHVIPSGSVDAATRATFLDLYEGIALDAPAAGGKESGEYTELGAHGYSKPPYNDFSGKNPNIGPLVACSYKTLICVTSTYNTPIDSSVTTVSCAIDDVCTYKSLICTTITLDTPIDDSVTTVSTTINC